MSNQFSNNSANARAKAKARGNGEGSVYPIKTKSGVKWICAFTDIKDNKVRKRFPTKKAAEEYRSLQHVAKIQGVSTSISHPKTTVSEFLDEWLTSKTELEVTTKDNYRKAITNWIEPHIGSLKLGRISPRTFDELFIQLSPLSGGTQRIVYTILNQAFDRAERLGDLPTNPMRNTKRPGKKSKAILPIPKNDFDIIYSHASQDPRMHAYVEILGIIGPRGGEVLALTWDDVDFEKLTINLTKTLKDRNSEDIVIGNRKTHDELLVPFTERTQIILQEWKNAESLLHSQYRQHKNLIFPDKNGGYKDLRNNRRDWAQFLKSISMPHYNLHRLRKTAFSRFAEVASPGLLRAYSGHKSVSTTLDFYVSIEEDVVRQKLRELEQQNPLSQKVVEMDEFRRLKKAI